jgi:hypothetical protein
MTARRKQLEREVERLITDPESELDVSLLSDTELQGVVNSAGHAQVFRDRFGKTSNRRKRVRR